MPHIAGYERSQTLLFREAVDDYIGPENPARLIDAFVNGLDLAATGFARVAPEVTGDRGMRPQTCLL